MSGETTQGIATLRAKIAERHPDFATADAFEQEIETACMQMRSNLRAARKRLGVDQATLAKRMQVGQPMISRIENGIGDIGLKTLFRYAKALDIVLSVTLNDTVSAVAGPEQSAVSVEGAIDKARQLLGELEQLDAAGAGAATTRSEQREATVKVA